MSDIDPRLTRVCENYRRAVHAKDVAAFLGLYHPSARVFDTWGVWSFEGETTRRKVIEQCLPEFRDEWRARTPDKSRPVSTPERENPPSARSAWR